MSNTENKIDFWIDLKTHNGEKLLEHKQHMIGFVESEIDIKSDRRKVLEAFQKEVKDFVNKVFYQFADEELKKEIEKADK